MVVRLDLGSKMRKNAGQKERWTLDCPDDVRKPNKPSHLRTAVDRLGPFKFETQAEARRHGHLVMLGDQECGISKELAQELVKDIACRFNVEEHLARGAPRFAHVLDRLTVIRDMAVALADELDLLDDISRYELLRGNLNAEAGPLMRASRAHNLYLEWISQLRKRSMYIERVQRFMVERRKREKREPIDRGGNTNMWKEQQGAPRWGLVNDAIQIFELFKAGEATGTERGNFHEFVNDVFEYATGREGTTHAKVESWVKILVKAHREARKLQSVYARHDAEWNSLTDRDPMRTSIDTEKRLLEIVRNEMKLDQRQWELWQAMWPHAYRLQ
jgi:hypothetical protein